jgi:hypothetical protein
LRKENDDPHWDIQDDEIKPEDGLVRYWMFLSGDQVRVFSALASAIFGVAWCFLYVLGAGRSLPAVALGSLAVVCFFVWRLFDRQLREYDESGWKKDEHSHRRDKIEIRVAIILWLFIFISIGAIVLSRWWHAH